MLDWLLQSLCIDIFHKAPERFRERMCNFFMHIFFGSLTGGLWYLVLLKRHTNKKRRGH